MNKKEIVNKYLREWIDQNPEAKFIPSENALKIKLGFSRNTVRSAIKHLCELDIIIPIKGKGYAINLLKPNSLNSYSNQYDVGEHKSVFVKEIHHEDYKKELKVNKYVEIIKVRYKNNVPFILTHQFIPEFIFSTFKDELYKETLYGAVEASGESIAFARKRTTYIKTPESTKIFMPNIGDTTLLLESLTFNRSNRAIEYSLNYYYPELFEWDWTEKKI